MKHLKTIVIVDDQVAEDLKHIIEKNNKENIREIITFNSRKDFIYALKKELKYDILLLDCGMPEDLTIKETKKIAEKYNPQATYILTSGDILPQSVAKEFGFSGFIDKAMHKEQIKNYL